MPRTKQFDQQEVLDKAVELFWKKGFHATSMQDLVEHLGINRGSLYDTYGSKDELFEQVLERYNQRNGEWLLDFIAPYDSAKEAIAALLEHSIESSISDVDCKGCLIVNSATELIPGAGDRISSKLCGNEQGFEGVFTRLIKAGQKTGEIDPEKDAASVAGMLMTFNSGLKVQAKINPDGDKLRAMTRQALTVLD